MHTFIVVKLEVEGLHQWKECNLEYVSYLRYPHRHIFYIECSKEVKDDNREIEIINYKHRITNYLYNKYGTNEVCLFGNLSCEMIAKELVNHFKLSSCRVLEDNENGAEVIV